MNIRNNTRLNLTPGERCVLDYLSSQPNALITEGERDLLRNIVDRDRLQNLQATSIESFYWNPEIVDNGMNY